MSGWMGTVRSRRTVLIGLVVVAGCVACGNSTPGVPHAAPRSSATTSTNSASTVLPVDRVCSLLSATDLAGLNVSKPPKEQMVGTAHTCQLDTSNYSIGIGIRTDAGLARFQAGTGTVTGLRIGRHDADRELDDTGACTIGLGVTDSSRVDVVADAFDGSDPCVETLRVARLVEPKLP